MKKQISILILIGLLNNSNCLNWFYKCHRPNKTQENFELNKLIGSWFIYSYSKGTILDYFECMKTIYKPSNIQNAVISNSIAWSAFTSWLDYSVLNYVDSNSKKAILSSIPKEEQVSDFWNNNIDYFILDTNYTDYLIGYYCNYKYFGLASEQVYYVLSRKLNLDNSILNLIESKLNKLKPKSIEMKQTVHDNVKCNLFKSYKD